MASDSGGEPMSGRSSVYGNGVPSSTGSTREDPVGGPSGVRKETQRNLAAFFMFGIINNIIYAIFLSAAVDILEGGNQGIPKSTVLLADVGPCILVKMIAPYFVRIIPYRTIVAACVVLDTVALLLVGYPQSLYDLGRSVVWVRFMGVLLASASTGLGETAFLGLTTYYEPSAVVAWSAGTGTAGVVGSLYYLVMASVLQLSLPVITTIALVLPIGMCCAYAFLLQTPMVVAFDPSPGLSENLEVLEIAPPAESDAVASTPSLQSAVSESQSAATSVLTPEMPLREVIRRRLRMVRPLLLPFVLPLFLVFFAEYTINQSVYYALMFPLDQTPFKRLKDHYVTYSALYMVGAFLSRSFGRLLPLIDVWWFTSGQLGMLVLLVTAALTSSLPTPLIDDIWVVFGLILVEGLFGGLAYVHAFCSMTRRVRPSRLEFSMAFTSVADSLGIGCAAVMCMYLEPILCEYNAQCRAQRVTL